MSDEESNVRRPSRLRMPVLVAILSLAIVASAAQASEDEKNKVPKGGTKGEIVRFIAEIAIGVWEVLKPSDETEDEGTSKQEAGSESDQIVQFFGIQKNEYKRWPERWQQALRQVYASPERFRRQTIHTLKMMHASDWELVEKLAPYAIGVRLFAENPKIQGFRVGDIKLGNLFEMEAMGLISAANGSISTTLKPRSQNKLYRAYKIGDYGLVLWFRNGDHTVKWRVTPITRTGRELLNLLGAKPNTRYLHKLGQAFAEHGIRAELWEVTQISKTGRLKLEKQIWELLPKEAGTDKP